MPIVAEADYDALRRVMPLPATYEEWLNLTSEWANKYGQKGIVHIQVRPIEFLEYTTNAGKNLDIQSLLEFISFNPWSDPD